MTSAPRWTCASTTPGSTWRPVTSRLSAAGRGTGGDDAGDPAVVDEDVRPLRAVREDDGAAGQSQVVHGVAYLASSASNAGLPTAAWRSSQVAITSVSPALEPVACSSA